MEKKKVLDVAIEDKKLSYDDIVNVRKDVSDIKLPHDKTKIFKLVAVLIMIIAIVFCSLLLFGLI